jgi:putative acetyltransferase
LDFGDNPSMSLQLRGMSIAEAASWAEKLTVAGVQWKISGLEIWVAEIGAKVVGWGAIRSDRLEGLYTDPEICRPRHWD